MSPAVEAVNQTPTPAMAPPAVASSSNKSPFSGTTSPEAANRAPHQAKNAKPATLLKRADWMFGLIVGIVVVGWLINLALGALNRPNLMTDQLVGTFVLVKGGDFTMGCQDGLDSEFRDDETPTHQVTLGTFYLGQTEVTQAQWRAVMGNNPSSFGNCDACPVELVSWEDIQVFLTKLNNRSGGARYRLPTESEWEYAARGGQSSRGYVYAGGNTIDHVAWNESNSSDKTHPVKGKSANELGLYDMSGNVWEWCSDWYGDYPHLAKVDPRGPASGSDRVLRGGGWGRGAGYCRVSFRGSSAPGNGSDAYGFRLCSSPQ